MFNKARKRLKKGFTLVELLIVVAILGVLATVGVPAYRQMIQKSRKAEAKVNLGNVSTVEGAFFSEFGGYGNNLQGMGYEMEGTGFTYTIGFTNSAANCGAPGAILPDPAKAIGQAVLRSSPNYYPPPKGTGPVPRYRYGNMNFANCHIPTKILRCTDGVPANDVFEDPPKYDVYTTLKYDTSDCTKAPVAGGESNAYTAVASGCIQQGQDPNTCGTQKVDAWAMNEARVLSNVQDGVQ